MAFGLILGDLTARSLRNEFLWVADVVKDNRHPILTVVGNHDGLIYGEEIYNHDLSRRRRPLPDRPCIPRHSSNETFYSLPDKHPDGYYPPIAYFFAFQTALAYNNGYFLMASMLDYCFEVLARNPRGSVSNASLISLGFGKVH